MNEDIKPSRLIVIGNGFDKWCKLKSSFSDFMNYQARNKSSIYNKISLMRDMESVTIDEYLKIFDNINSSHNFTFWDLVFILNTVKDKNGNWCDAEQIIYNTFSSDDEINMSNEVNQFVRANLWDTWNNFIQGMTPINRYINVNDNIVVLYLIYLKIVTKKGFNDIQKKQEFYEFLFSELNLFEKKFSKYMLSQTHLSNQYDANRILLLQYIANFNLFNVMSFNYTYVREIYNLAKCENVHGTLSSVKDSDCIIGIDGQDIEHFEIKYRFTKTYRKVELYTKNMYKNIIDVFDPNIKEIHFFGHSLNEQDYAYFQTMFDIYNIYESDVKLVFLYSIYDKSIQEEIQFKTTSSVIRLIQKYGETIREQNNKKGRNLLHRLLVQSRIRIEQIPQDSLSVLDRHSKLKTWYSENYQNYYQLIINDR